MKHSIHVAGFVAVVLFAFMVNYLGSEEGRPNIIDRKESMQKIHQLHRNGFYLDYPNGEVCAERIDRTDFTPRTEYYCVGRNWRRIQLPDSLTEIHYRMKRTVDSLAYMKGINELYFQTNRITNE